MKAADPPRVLHESWLPDSWLFDSFSARLYVCQRLGGSSSNGAKIYSKDPVFGLLRVKNRSQTAKTREHCVKYMREIRIERKFRSCQPVFHAVNGSSIVGVGPVWRNY